MFQVDGDEVINFMNERDKYEKTIEELNEKVATYENNKQIMEGLYIYIIFIYIHK